MACLVRKRRASGICGFHSPCCSSVRSSSFWCCTTRTRIFLQWLFWALLLVLRWLAQEQHDQHGHIHRQNHDARNFGCIVWRIVPSPDSRNPTQTDGVNDLSPTSRDQPQDECVIEPALRHARAQQKKPRVAVAESQQGNCQQHSWKYE